MKRSFVWLLLLLLNISPLHGASKFLDKHPAVLDDIALLDVWIEEQTTYQKIPGLAIGRGPNH